MTLPILKKTTFLLCAGAMLVFTSCGGEEPENMDDGTSTETVNDAPRSLINDNASGNQDADGSAGFGTENDASQNMPLNTNADGSNAVRINPPHGEPGHDCAVPVGNPLPSAGGGSSSPTITPTITPTVNTPKTNSSVKLNPPHGEPGHDCAVPVGNPLN